MKELTKEEILSKRIGTYGFTKLELSKPIICPIEALDAMKEYSDQNTKPLLDEIAELRKALNQIQDYQMDFVELARTTTVYKIAESALNKLKASKSEANEWISVFKEVPNEHVRVLCIAEINGCWIEEVCLFDKENHRFIYNRNTVRVQWWMQLPKPPIK